MRFHRAKLNRVSGHRACPRSRDEAQGQCPAALALGYSGMQEIGRALPQNHDTLAIDDVVPHLDT